MPASTQLSLCYGRFSGLKGRDRGPSRAVKERVLSRSITPAPAAASKASSEMVSTGVFFARLALSDDVTHGMLLTDVRKQFQ